MKAARDLQGSNLILDFLCVLSIFFGTNAGVYLLNPGIDVTDAPRAVVALAFYGGPTASVLLIGACFGTGKVAYETSWRLLLPYFLIAILTTPASTDAFLTVTSLIRDILLLGAIAAFVRVRGGEAFFRIVTSFLLVTNIYSLFEVVFVPGVGIHGSSNSEDYGLAGSWRGIFVHKNVLGQAAVVTLIPLLFFPELLPWPRLLSYGFAAICLRNLVGSHSATSEMTLIACIPAYLIFLRNRASTKAVVIGLVLCIATGVVLSMVLPLVLDLFGRDLTFSHRSEIWDFTAATIHDRPILGYGYAAGSKYLGGLLTAHLFHAAVDAHNAYLQTAAECGYPGMVALIFALVAGIARVLLDRNFEPRRDIATVNRAFALILVAAVISGFTEVAPAALGSTTGFVTYAAILSISRVAQRRRRAVVRGPRRRPQGVPA